jgi:hypothetical protein
VANAFGTAVITIVLKDNGGTTNGGQDTSVAQTLTINVTSVNDAPAFTKGADQTVAEDAGFQFVNNWATGISSGPSEFDGLTFQVTNNTNPGLFQSQPFVSTGFGALQYSPAANANGIADITIVLKDTGGTANGGVITSRFSRRQTSKRRSFFLLQPSTQSQSVMSMQGRIPFASA